MANLLKMPGSLNCFLSEHRLVEDASCIMCNSPSEDWKHVLYDCPAYADLRSEIPEINNSDQMTLLRDPTKYNVLKNFSKLVFYLRDIAVGRAY